MDEAIELALSQDRLIDITTTGRNSGRARRIEIWFHYQDGRVYLTGSPGRRGWYANLVAQPDFIFHLKQSVRRDIAARATSITDKAQRLEIFTRMRELEERMSHTDLEEWVQRSPLLEVALGE